MIVSVRTRHGVLTGGQDQGVHCFRSVPYAAPPTGRWRLRAPRPPEPWSGARAADRRPPAPPQPGGGAQDEDCLFLDIWTSGESGVPRPVLVFVRNEDFSSGGIDRPEHCGRRLARRGDAVVVMVQHRLGALGFLHLADLCPELEEAASPGLLDLVAALSWVRDEIDAFGGDPHNVTLIGASSGATSALALLASPRARGLFHRVVAQSGHHELLTRERATAIAARRLRELSLEPGDLGALQKLSAADWLGVQDPLDLRPVIDGELVRRSPLDALSSGEAKGIPLLIGCNLDEDPSLRASAERIADAHSDHEPRTFAYRFGGPEQPSHHGAEIPFMLGTLEEAPDAVPTARTRHLAKNIQDSWLSFARTGDPSHSAIGTWPAYDRARRATMRLQHKE
jgi:para-nitrobenzyl esterase